MVVIEQMKNKGWLPHLRVGDGQGCSNHVFSSFYISAVSSKIEFNLPFSSASLKIKYGNTGYGARLYFSTMVPQFRNS